MAEGISLSISYTEANLLTCIVRITFNIICNNKNRISIRKLNRFFISINLSAQLSFCRSQPPFPLESKQNYWAKVPLWTEKVPGMVLVSMIEEKRWFGCIHTRAYASTRSRFPSFMNPEIKLAINSLHLGNRRKKYPAELATGFRGNGEKRLFSPMAAY